MKTRVKFPILFFASFCFGEVIFLENANAKLQVITTTADLKSIVSEVAEEDVIVESIAKGTQDPHFIEPKPSYMVKLSHADLVVAIGLGLEVGWIPSLVRGSRNPKIAIGSNGFLEVGPACDPIEVPISTVTRAEGDVHPEGNPHVTLDPGRIGIIGQKIADRLAELDPSHSAQFHERSKKLKERMSEKAKAWKQRIEKSGIKTAISYHKTLNYFFRAFGIENPIDLEPKPGIPPTSKHLIDVIRVVKEKKIPVILVENFFDEKIASRVKEDVPDVRIVSVPVSVGGAQGIEKMDDLFEKLVTVIEGK